MSANSVKNSIISETPIFSTINRYDDSEPMTHEERLSLIRSVANGRKGLGGLRFVDSRLSLITNPRASLADLEKICVEKNINETRNPPFKLKPLKSVLKNSLVYNKQSSNNLSLVPTERNSNIFLDKTIIIQENFSIEQERKNNRIIPPLNIEDKNQSYMEVAYNSKNQPHSSRTEMPQIIHNSEIQQSTNKEIRLPNLKLNRIKINQKHSRNTNLPNNNKSTIESQSKKYNDDISQILNKNKIKSANLTLNASSLLSSIISKNNSNTTLTLTASVPIYKKNPKLLKIYKQDAVLQNEIVRVKNNKNTNCETLENYQQNLFNVVNGSLCSDSLIKLSHKFRDLQDLSKNGTIKKKETKWSKLAKKIKNKVPDYLIEKFNQL